MLKGLPKWAIPDIHPAIYDHESATTIEMVAKLYSKIKELIESYNNFVKDMSEKIDDAYDYLKTNLYNTCTAVINEMIRSGKFYVGVTYNEDEESLNIIFSEVNSNE